MASTSQTHPAFPNRPYPNTVHGKLPERNAPAGFGATSTRETARLERERQERERAQREAQVQQAGSSNPLNALTDEQREEINEAFALFDLDKDQRIDYHEFKVALKALGFDLPKPEILSLLTAHGVSPSQPSASSNQRQPQNPPPIPPGRMMMTLPGFQTVAARLISERDPRDEILRAFALFDTDDKGMISLEDLRRVARELGEGLEEEELVAMIEEFDLEGKGGWGGKSLLQYCWF
ncbi:hypothetical protein B0O99DRAFT_668361 [Bisporella sp. PMI_857]|nr:hypothetical protein B0O99DRAFT_668361 [Bisporella sp. PMI_857]